MVYITKEDTIEVEDNSEMIVEDAVNEKITPGNDPTPMEEVPRVRNCAGLRQLKNSPGSHRNKFKKEFNYLTTSLRRNKKTKNKGADYIQTGG